MTLHLIDYQFLEEENKNMVIKKVDLYEYYSIERNGANGGFLTLYILENSPEINMKRKYPCMMIFPGGGYEFVSDREKDPIALHFVNHGFISCYLDYSIKPHAINNNPLKEAMMALKYIKENAEKYNIINDKIAGIGFSAGGHLLGLLSTLTKEEKKLVDNYSFDLNASIYSYPVISSEDKITHLSSFLNLGADTKAKRDKLSIDKRINNNSPISFIWHTKEDIVVPYENSLILKEALDKYDINNEIHIFEKGNHGYSRCDSLVFVKGFIDESINQASEWLIYLNKWLKDNDFIIYD